MKQAIPSILRNRIFQHVLFWVTHLVFYATLYGSFQENYRQTFFEELLYLPVRIIFTYFTLSAVEKIAFGEKVFLNRQQNALVLTIQVVRSVHVMVYIIWGLLLIRRFDKLLENNFSETEKIDLHKCQNLLRLFVIICLVSIAIFIAGFFIPFHLVTANNLVGLSISLLIYILAYMSWSRPEVKVHQLVSLSSTGQNSVYTDEKSRSTLHLPDEHYQKLSAQLEKLIIDEKVYLENELSLAQLSEKLNIQPYQTSELISRQYQESFFDLINRHRVEEVKKRLHDPAFSHLSILGVALDCGFNSKSSFNTAFKKFTGQTPSQYRSIRCPTF